MTTPYKNGVLTTVSIVILNINYGVRSVKLYTDVFVILGSVSLHRDERAWSCGINSHWRNIEYLIECFVRMKSLSCSIYITLLEHDNMLCTSNIQRHRLNNVRLVSQ